MAEPYFLPRGYEARLEPEYFVDEDLKSVAQPDLYPEAATVARRLDSHRIVDVGCGTAGKLAALHPEFDIVGIDFGSNIAACRERYDFGTWIETDLDSSADLGFDDVARATIVCGDVIEHLVYPERLLRMLRAVIDRGAAVILLTTPERELFNGPDHLGPPPNEAHVREWTLPELERFLASQGLAGHFGLTRSNDALPYMRNIIAAVPGNDATSRAVVRDWFEERRRWEQLAVDQDRFIADHETWSRDLTAAKDWAQEQYLAWKERAEAAEEQVARADEQLAQSEERLAQSGLSSSEENSDESLAVEQSPPRITVVTEVDENATGLDATYASLVAQTFHNWEWAIATTNESVRPPADDSRIRVVQRASRARALADALAGSGEIALLEAGETISPTAFEKWLWFLEASPDCTSVHSSTLEDGSHGPRLLRRSAVEAAGGLDAAAEVTLASAGFVPLPDARPPEQWGHRSPSYLQTANEWLPLERSIWNPVPKSARRLLLIVPFMTVGGADKVTLDLVDQLSARGWEFTVATTIDGAYELYPEYEKRTTELFPLAHFLPLTYQPLFLRHLIESRKPDAILISNSELGYRLLPYLRGMCPDTPMIDFCHSETEHWNNGGYPRLSVDHRQFLDLTLTASDHLRRWMIERGGDESRIEVCHANVDVHAFRPMSDAPDAVRRQLGLPLDEPTVLFVGRVSEDKQPRVLAAALAQLRKRKVRFTAVIAGDGPDQRWLGQALVKSGSARDVRMLGALSSQEIAPLMAAADVFFLPSRSEGIALALYEAMASGTPVVGARVGGQAELVTEECGFLVERSTAPEEAERYADAIEQLLRDPVRRSAMGAAARARVESDFSLERLGQRADELLQRAGDLHRSSPHPLPTPTAARASATQTIELMRLASLLDASWYAQLQPGSGSGVGVSLYVLLRTLLRPVYYWGTRHGWSWLPRLRDALLRKLAGVSV